MAGRYQNSNTAMDQEFFKPIEPLGSPGGSAKPVKLANALAGLTALAAAAAALFFFYVVTTARYIGTDTATIEVQLVNREAYQDIYWTLVQGPPPETPPPGKHTLLEKDEMLLHLENLESGTKYTIVFLEYDEHGEATMVHTFTFITDGWGRPIPPEISGDPPADPPSPPDDPPDDPPGPPEDPEDGDGAPDPIPQPPVKPPSPPKKTGKLNWDERGVENSITSDYTKMTGDTIPVKVTFGAYTPGDYTFRITDVELVANNIELTENDYRNYRYSVGSDKIVLRFDLVVDPAWLTDGYTTLAVYVKGGNYENGKRVGSISESSVVGQVNLEQGYAVPELSSVLGVGGYGLKLTDVYMSAGSKEDSSLTDVVPGQKVYVSLGFTGSATRDFTLKLTGSSMITMNKDTVDVRQGSDEEYLRFEFDMPDRDVTEADLGLSLTAVSADGGGVLTDPPTFAAPSPAPVPVAPAGPNSVGPLTISQSIHGLNVLSVTFSAGGAEGTQLEDVLPGETVYMNILLQGVSMKSCTLGASFASSLPGLQAVMTDTVQIGDSDAYLRYCFTMPNHPVTAAEIGFLGFTANQ